MNIVFTTTGGDLNAPLDPRFGRAARFLVYNSDTAGCELVDNQNLNASHGAGIQAAATVAEALALYREGKLSRALTANAQGHRP